MLLDFFAQVPNSVLKSPLRGADRRAQINNLMQKMHKCMDTGLHEVNPHCKALTIYDFKLLSKRC
jgi:hypothetical protein